MNYKISFQERARLGMEILSKQSVFINFTFKQIITFQFFTTKTRISTLF